jgi:glycosyltransferase involved in cell wall biosynthesis
MSERVFTAAENPGITLVTPIPPLTTGLATYALRILEGTSDLADWTVAYPEGGDPDSLPRSVHAVPLDQLAPAASDALIYNIGNSIECFDVVAALRRHGGVALLHEIVLHHMLRFGYLARGMLGEYRRELQFEYGPGAGVVEKRLSRQLAETEYDVLLKKYPLIGRTLHSASAAACLNPHALARIRGAFLPGRAVLIGHPLSPLPDLPSPGKPFPFTVGMVGSWHPGRNLDLVLDAMTILRLGFPEAGLLLAGGGYPTGLPDWTVTLGRLDETEYQGWIRSMDVAVDLRHPTCGETSGSLLEVMRAAVPAVVTASDAFLYLPSDGVLRVPPESVAQGLAASLALLRRDPGLRLRLGEAAREYSLSQGSAERMRDDWRMLITLARESSGGAANLHSGRHPQSHSVSAAWHPTPPGFERDLSTGPVSWRFDGRSVITGPESSVSATITAWGSGTVNGMALPASPATIVANGDELQFEGEGWLTGILWL